MSHFSRSRYCTHSPLYVSLSACWTPSMSMATKRNILKLSRAEQRRRFVDIAEYSDEQVSQALENSSGTVPWTFEAALKLENRIRNRYSNVLPWDSTRARVPITNGGSDYINASMIKLDENSYIAAQGPLRNTVHHFWAMCFDQAESRGSDLVLIAMVTPLAESNIEKCFKYWPSKHDATWDMGSLLRSERLKPEDLKVSWISEEKVGSLTVTNLRMECGGIFKNVLHYFYSGWEDCRTPNSVEPLFLLSKEIHKVKSLHPAVIPIIHCSAGVGRTGTFIAIDHFLTSDALVSYSKDPVFETVKKMRDQRMMMVQTIHQYSFLYDIVEKLQRGG